MLAEAARAARVSVRLLLDAHCDARRRLCKHDIQEISCVGLDIKGPSITYRRLAQGAERGGGGRICNAHLTSLTVMKVAFFTVLPIYCTHPRFSTGILNRLTNGM